MVRRRQSEGFMKRKKAIILLVCMCMVCIFAGLLTACGNSEQDYTLSDSPNSNGHSGVEVVYELEGGTYQNTKRHVRRYYYVPEGGETLISPPGENLDGKKEEIIRANYYITGWYRTRTENADGTVSYSDEWDFGKDKIKSGDPSLTLYCGWAAKIRHTYEICYYDEKGEAQVYTSIETQAGAVFADPSDLADGRPGFTAKRGKNEAGRYEICYYSGKDASGALIPWDPNFTHPGGETSTAVKVFVEYLEGDFTYVSTADEFLAAAKNYARSGNGVYLTDDIGLEGAETNGFRNNAGKFTGVFYGNGHTVKNFTLTYNVNDPVSNQQALLGDKALCISLFGNLEGATIEDVNFEGMSLTVNVSLSLLNDVYVAPLAILAKESSVKNVNVSGSITVERVKTSKIGELKYESMRLFWQEGVTGENCAANVTFTDNRP